ncbi:MAG: hypothetical protein U0Q16_25790 [Bryobacteraceae bacterium]
MTEKLHPLLPKTSVANFDKPGEIVGRPALEIDTIARGIDTDGAVSQINAVPDVWARPLLFQMALLNDKLKMHNLVRGEWMGMLAMLAFERSRQLPISRTAVKLGDDAGGFAEVAARLAPSDSLASNAKWTEITVVKWANRPIGMFSPSTIVCTATDYRGAIDREAVEWFNGEVLGDPIPHLSRHEKKELANWLALVSHTVANHPLAGGSLTQPVAGLLSDFIGALGGSGTVSVPVLAPVTAFFGPLQTPIAPPADGQSDVELVPSPGLGATSDGAVKRLLVVNNRIADDWKTTAKQIRVWQMASLQTLRGFSASDDAGKIGGQSLGQGVALLHEDNIFTETLAVVEGSNLFPGTMAGAGSSTLQLDGNRVTPIIPLRKFLLDYLTPKELVARIQFETLPGGGISVTLRVPLSGENRAAKGLDLKSAKDFVVRREYGARQIRRFSAPALEVWPSFRLMAVPPGRPQDSPPEDVWKAYYTYYSTEGLTSTFYATPRVRPGARVESSGDPGGKREVTLTETFPEALLCRETRDDLSREYGLMPLLEPDIVNGSNRHFRAGVDFGTTSTNVFASEGDGLPESLSFEKDRFLQVSESGDRRAAMRREFIPGATENTRHLLSLYHLMRRGPAIKPLLDGHIFYADTVNAVSEMSKRRELMANLKWGDLEQRKCAAVFLEQLCMQTLAELAARGAGSVTWRFSYPTAFGEQDLDDFQTIWQQITRSCESRTGIRVEQQAAKQSESVAAAAYFMRYSPSIEKGAVCVDVGGGTSDIAIWEGRNQIKLHTSIRLAGRDLLVTPLRLQPHVLESFHLEPKVLSDLREAAANPVDFAAQVDTLLIRDKDTKLMLGLPTLSADPLVGEFLNTVQAGVAGLFYYLGLLVQSLRLRHRYGDRLPDVLVGGNGSQILHWCARGRYTRDCAFDRLLRKMLAEATGMEETPDNPVKITISEHPKAEVAHGLVLPEKEMVLQSDIPDEELIAGEALLRANDHKLDWHFPLTASHILEGVRLEGEMPEFQKFVTALSGKPLPPAEIARIRDGVNQELANSHVTLQKKELAKHFRIEPIFTIALKRYVEERARRNRPVAMAAAGGRR